MLLWGALAGLTAPGWAGWPLAWVALVPLFAKLGTFQPVSGKHWAVAWRAAGLGAAFGGAYHLVVLAWVPQLHPLGWLGLSETQSRVVALCAWLFWAGNGALLWALLAVAYRRIAPPQAGGLRRLAAALAWGGLLWLYVQGNDLYPPWPLLCYGQAASPALLALAGVLREASPWALEALMVWVNAEMLALWRCVAPRWGVWRATTLWILLPLVVWGLAALWESGAGLPSKPQRLPPVAVIQGNLPIETIRDTGQARGPLARASQAAYYTPLRQADWPAGTWVVLPEEGAVVGWVALDTPLANPSLAALSGLARARGWRILAGASTFGSPAQGLAARRYYNSVLLLRPDGRWQVFHKRRLVPFGESSPQLGGLLPDDWLGALARALGAPPYETLFSSGPAHQPLLARAGPLVCMELVYPALAAGHRRAGATMLVSISNLGWFHGDGRMAAQFLAIGQFRAAETGLPLMIAANDGPSALIDARGRVRQQAMPLRAATLVGTGD